MTSEPVVSTGKLRAEFGNGSSVFVTESRKNSVQWHSQPRPARVAAFFHDGISDFDRTRTDVGSDGHSDEQFCQDCECVQLFGASGELFEQLGA